MNLDWELIMKAIHPFIITSLCLILLSNPVFAQSLFNDVPDESELKLTCYTSPPGLEILVASGEITIDKRGEKLIFNFWFGDIRSSQEYPITVSDDLGQRYIYKQGEIIPMVDFKKKRLYPSYNDFDYEDCW